MSKKFSMILLTLVIILMVVISSTVFAAPMKIRVSVCNAPSHPQNIGLEIFRQYVEAKTDGQVTVAVYPNSQ